jgi:hypothetical protein
MPFVADWRVTLGGGPPGVIQPNSCSRAREYRWVDVVEGCVRFSHQTAEELYLMHWNTDIVRCNSCTLS